MKRLFVGIAIPENVCESLTSMQGGIPGARWRPPENFHLTLRFIGEVDRHRERDIRGALDGIDLPAFELTLTGVGQFGKDRPHTLWAGVETNPTLMHLAAKVESAVQRAGLKPERRKYSPHVTLAYLRNPAPQDLNMFIAEHAGFRSETFTIEEFILYESRMGKGASHYVKREEFPLQVFEFEDEWENTTTS